MGQNVTLLPFFAVDTCSKRYVIDPPLKRVRYVCYAVQGFFSSERTPCVVCSAGKIWSLEHCNTTGLLETLSKNLKISYACCNCILLQAMRVMDAALNEYRTFPIAAKASLHMVIRVDKYVTGRGVRDCSRRCSRDREQAVDALTDCFSSLAFLSPEQ
jgi:hypothetical protein